MTCQASEYLSTVKWADESFSVSEFGTKLSLPQVGKTVKGTASSLNSSPSLLKCIPSPWSSWVPAMNSNVFWLKTVTKSRLIGVCTRCPSKVSPSTPSPLPLSFTGNKVVIDEDYNGWFEILSEEGRSVKPFESVNELAKRFPKKCLVRSPIKGFSGDKSRIIQMNEVLALEAVGTFCDKNPDHKFLKCHSQSGEIIFLRLDSKGKFSPIAKEDSISGVHNLHNLINKRLPMTIRLVAGDWPSTLKNVSPIIRLVHQVKEQVLIGISLLTESSHYVQLPVTSLGHRLVPPKNVDTLTCMTQYQSLIGKSKGVTFPTGSIHILPDDVVIPTSIQPLMNKGFEGHPSIQGYNHHPNSHHHSHHYHHHLPSQPRITNPKTADEIRTFNSVMGIFQDPLPSPPLPSSPLPKDEVSHSPMSCKENCDPTCAVGKEIKVTGGLEPLDEETARMQDDIYDQIDQIYDYIRGFAPLPERVQRELRETALTLKMTQHQMRNSRSGPPPPPPPSASSSYQNFSNQNNLNEVKRQILTDHRRLSYPSCHPIEESRSHIGRHQNLNHVHSQRPSPVFQSPSGARGTFDQPNHLIKRPMRSNSVGRIYGTDTSIRTRFHSNENQLKRHHLFIKPRPNLPLTNGNNLNHPISSHHHNYHHPFSHPHPTTPPNPSPAANTSSNHLLKGNLNHRNVPSYHPDRGMRKDILTSSMVIPPLNPSPPMLSESDINRLKNPVNGSIYGTLNHHPNPSFNPNPNPMGSSTIGSPIFNIRYKSLTNISLSPLSFGSGVNEQLVNEKIGTLDSSNSNSGRATASSKETSSGPSGSSGFPRAKKGKVMLMSKPKSLNNIFRELVNAFSGSSSRASSSSRSRDVDHGEGDGSSSSPDPNLSSKSSNAHPTIYSSGPKLVMSN